MSEVQVSEFGEAPFSAEIKRFVAWANVQRPLFIARKLQNSIRPALPRILLDEVSRKFSQDGNQKTAAVDCSEVVGEVRKLPDASRKFPHFLQGSKVYSQLNDPEQAKAMVTEALDLLPSFKEFRERAVNAVSLASVARSVGDGREAKLIEDLISEIKGGKMGIFQLSEVAETLAENDFPEQAVALSLFGISKYKRRYLGDKVAQILISKNRLDDAMTLAVEGKHEKTALRVADALFKAGRVADCVALCSKAKESLVDLNELTIKMVKAGNVKEALVVSKRLPSYYRREVIVALFDAGEEARGLEFARTIKNDDESCWLIANEIASRVGVDAALQFIDELPKTFPRETFYRLTVYGLMDSKTRELKKEDVEKVKDRALAETDPKIAKTLTAVSQGLLKLGYKEEALGVATEALRRAETTEDAIFIFDVLRRSIEVFRENGAGQAVLDTLHNHLPQIRERCLQENVELLLTVAEAFDAFGDSENAKILIKDMIGMADKINKTELSRIASRLIEREDIDSYEALSENLKVLSWDVGTLATALISKGRSDLAKKLEGYCGDDSARATLAETFIGLGLREEAAKVLEKLDDSQLYSVASYCIDTSLFDAVPGLFGIMKDDNRKTGVVGKLVESGKIDLALELLRNIKDFYALEDERIAVLLQPEYKEKTLGVVRNLEGYGRIKVLGLEAEDKMRLLAHDYLERKAVVVSEADRSYTPNFDSLYQSFVSSKRTPDAQFMEALAISGASRETVEKFVNLLPQEQRAGLRIKYGENSGQFLAEAFGGIATPELVQFLKEAEIDFSDLVRNWSKHFFTSNIELIDHVENLQKIESLEPGCVSTLHREFGISFFLRYPAGMIVDMYRERDEAKPYGVILLAQHDWNGTFYRKSGMWQEMDDKIGGRYLVRIVEAENKVGIARRLLELNRRYGDRHKISFLVIGGHGNPQGVRFGDGEGGSVEISDLDGTANSRLKNEIYATKMPFAFISCSTGAEGGIAQKFSSVFEANTVGPKIPTSEEHITPVFSESGQIMRFEVSYSENSAQNYTAGVLVKNV